MTARRGIDARRRRPNPSSHPTVTIPEGALLFHGTLEPFDGDLAPGGDGLVWFADDPRVAQLYIRRSGSTLYASPDHLTRPSRDENVAAIQRAIGIDYDPAHVSWDGARDRPASFRLPAGWERLPTERDVETGLARSGYRRGRYGAYEFRFHEGRLLGPGEVVDGRLFVATVLESLVVWAKALGEGDLLNVQYNDLGGFRGARRAGLDGVLIDDFAQSEAYGNFGHQSVGLFEEAVTKLSATSVPARYREWQWDLPGTPEWPDPPPPLFKGLLDRSQH